MASEQEFKDAAERVKGLTKRPSNDELLSLYSLYKQATTGDVSGKRPGAFKMKDRAKFDAWTKIKGKSQDAARDEYVALVNRLAGN
jgi:diazepam-binding inhibitor (GABA receptor modulator, acyl-CoA-binding protein)